MGEGVLQQWHHGVQPSRDEDDEELFESDAFSSDSDDDEYTEDETSSSSNSSSKSSLLNADGPLYELSSLMEQLPIKRGLSKYYQGKSQSYASLAVVSSIEDLPKKETPYTRKMKTCKSYAGGMENASPLKSSAHEPDKSPSCCAPLMMSKSSRPPPIPVQKTPCPH